MSEFRKTHAGNLYFVTLSVVGWIDIFIRPVYKDLIIDNLIHCQLKEGLEIYEYVIMSSHLHMIAARKEGELHELLGRFKSYTAKKLIEMIVNNPQESRKDWMLNLFEHFGKGSHQYSKYHFWNYTNFPTELWSPEVIDQKVQYIHDNPVRAGIVDDPHHYLYSSACEMSPLKTLEL